jgi:hypothetical protein
VCSTVLPSWSVFEAVDVEGGSYRGVIIGRVVDRNLGVANPRISCADF